MFELLTLDAKEGQQALFEVCSEQGFADTRWEALRFEIWHQADDAKVATHRVTEFKDRRPIAQCMTTFRGQMLADGPYSLRVLGDAPMTHPPTLRATGKSWGALHKADGGMLALFLLGILLCLGSSLSQITSREDGQPKRAAVAFALLVLSIVGASFLPIGGAMSGFLSGLLIASAEIGLVFWLSKGFERTSLLAWFRSRWLLAAPFLGGVIWILGRMISRLIPSTGIAPIEQLVAWPSGMFAVAAIGLLAPVAEELFFRGLIYGHMVRNNKETFAIVVSFLAFAVVHLPQQWGAWGAFASVTFTGLMLTLLRRFTKSTAVCAVAHLAHNATITFISMSYW